MAVTVNSEPIDRLVDESLNPNRTSSAVADAGVFSAPKATLAPVPLFAQLTSGITLVVPARNEARNLPVVLESIPDFVDDVILVDGHSRDATVAMATHCRPDIRIIYQESPGKGAALRAGFLAAQGDIIVMMDADGSMSAQEIPHFLWYLDHGFDFVKGSRFAAGGGSADITVLRRAGNRALLAMVNTLYKAQLTDLCYGFPAFRPSWLESLDLTAVGFEIETEMIVHAPSSRSPHCRGTELRAPAAEWSLWAADIPRRVACAANGGPGTPLSRPEASPADGSP